MCSVKTVQMDYIIDLHYLRFHSSLFRACATVSFSFKIYMCCRFYYYKLLRDVCTCGSLITSYDSYLIIEYSIIC